MKLSNEKEVNPMFKTIKEVLQNTKEKYENKIIFSEINREITYKDFYDNCSAGATFLIESNLTKKNVIIFIDKTIHCLEAMFSCAFAGVCYTIIDVNSPKDRVDRIIDTLKPSAIITDTKNYEKSKIYGENILKIEELVSSKGNESKVNEINSTLVDTDPLYILFTSGSTGMPKGSVICHRSVIDYATVICKTFNITEKTIFGSQTPFYFSMSILDIFATIVRGATFNIIPKMYFSFPVKLIEHLNTYKINTIYWVPSALSIVVNFKTLDTILPEYLHTILFAGEVMPTKQLNMWRAKLPNALYANLYGPTEITDTCTYYIVNRDFKDEESLPIGVPFENCDILIIKEDGESAKKGEVGELCVRGSFLGLGYYNQPEKTASAFVQNPLNPYYPELIYKTGDLVYLNEQNEIIYLGRKDFQIKHMGYRIELGEIESNIFAIEGILSCACIYDLEKSSIVLFYQSNTLKEEDVLKEAKAKLVPYMVPNEIVRLAMMPINSNGKIDRVKLKEMER